MSLFDPLTAFGRYLKSVEGLSPGTARQYELDCRKLAGWLEVHKPKVQDWPQVQAQDLIAYIDDTHPAPARSRRLNASWRKLWTYLGAVHNLSMSVGPVSLVRPKLPRRPHQYLKPEQVSRLLTAAREQRSEVTGLRDWAFLAFLYGTGCRVSEALNLTMDAIEYDLDNLPVQIQVIGKGNKARQLYLSPTAQRALREWLRLRRSLGDPANPVVFCALSGKRRGQAYSVRALELAALRAARRAGLPLEKCTPHKLRHAHATALSNAGRRLEEIQEVLGHESVATTRKYVDVMQDRLRATAASLPDVF